MNSLLHFSLQAPEFRDDENQGLVGIIGKKVTGAWEILIGGTNSSAGESNASYVCSSLDRVVPHGRARKAKGCADRGMSLPSSGEQSFVYEKLRDRLLQYNDPVPHFTLILSLV